MDVLKTHRDFIAANMNVIHAADTLKCQNYINEFDMYSIKNEVENESRMAILLNLLTENYNYKGVIKLLDIIRTSYPKIGDSIPEIQMGHRIRISLGGQKMLKIAIYNLTLSVDIRQYKVITFLFFFFLFLSFFYTFVFFAKILKLFIYFFFLSLMITVLQYQQRTESHFPFKDSAH